jgi:acetaldehyde dehydrogenase (acetylating)
MPVLSVGARSTQRATMKRVRDDFGMATTNGIQTSTWLTVNEAAQYLSVKSRTLAQFREKRLKRI